MSLVDNFSTKKMLWSLFSNKFIEYILYVHPSPVIQFCHVSDPWLSSLCLTLSNFVNIGFRFYLNIHSADR